MPQRLRSWKALALASVMVAGVSAGAKDNPQRKAASSAIEKVTRNVAIVVWDGVELLDFAGPGEVFQAAGIIGAEGDKRLFNVYTVAKTRRPIVSQLFLTVVPQYTIKDCPVADIIVLPGGGTRSVKNDPEMIDWIKQSADSTEVFMSVCTGALLLAKAGLLDGLEATTWHGAIDLLKKEAPKAKVREKRRFVDNGKIVTTAGVSAGIDGALHLVDRLHGRALAKKTAKYMEYRWKPEE
ncbi:MAG: DJ-1/PfpI family protein [Phycisphaerae bacterium]|jgi:transcriptional regulator GlxA family with amidase domain